MKENLYTFRTDLRSRAVALALVVIAAGIVGYTAWQTTTLEISKNQSVDLVQYQHQNTRFGQLYLATTASGTTGVAGTYSLDIESQAVNLIFDHPFHSAFYPVQAGAAIVSMPEVELTAEELTSENSIRPAFVDLESGEFNYLATPTGINEQHYRLEPVDSARLAYMQQAETASDPEQTDISNWEVVIHMSDDSTSDTVIASAMYPEWVTRDYVSYLQPDGIAVLNLANSELININLPFTDFSIANQYLVSLGSTPSPRILLLATGESQFSVLDGDFVSDDEFETEVLYTVEEQGTVFINPVLSPDQTEFAVQTITSVLNEETGRSELVGGIRIYNFDQPKIQQEILLESYTPEETTLLGWH